MLSSKVTYNYNGQKIELKEKSGLKFGWQLLINGIMHDELTTVPALTSRALYGKIGADSVKVTLGNKILFLSSELYINGKLIDKRRFN